MTIPVLLEIKERKKQQSGRMASIWLLYTSKGSAGGHNGIKNIIAKLGTDRFMRVKVGVGEKPKNWDLADYVLSPFTKDERPLVNLAIEHAAKAVEQMLNGDVDAAMHEYNRKSDVYKRHTIRMASYAPATMLV